MAHTEDPEETVTSSEPTRRDFLYYATAGVGAVAAGAAVWPLINQMSPSANVRALSNIQVPIGDVSEGTQLTVKYLGKPIFIRRRTQKEIQEARAVDVSSLRDQDARNPNIDEGAPATDANRVIGDDPQWLVQIGVCTHLGCVPLGDGAGDYDGWFCPCHGSQYDSAGRIRRGPAPENLHLPVAKFLDKTTLQLGEEGSEA